MIKPVVQTVPVSVLAKVLILTERRVQQLTTEGILKKEGRGKYPLIPNVQAYIKYWQDRAVGSDSGQTTDLHTERTRLTKAQADKTELEAMALRGVLVDAGEVSDLWCDMIGSMRAKLISIPTKTAHELINISEFSIIEGVLREHVYEALNELSNELSVYSNGIESQQSSESTTQSIN